MVNGQGKLTVCSYRYKVDLLIAFKAILCFVISHAKLISLIVTIWNLWCESRVLEFRNIWMRWSNIYNFPWNFNVWIMNKRNKGKLYIKDNLGILNALGILFVCFIGPVVYRFTLIMCDCMVCKKLLLIRKFKFLNLNSKIVNGVSITFRSIANPFNEN